MPREAKHATSTHPFHPFSAPLPRWASGNAFPENKSLTLSRYPSQYLELVQGPIVVSILPV
jgi:hypothetical protein